MIQFNLLPDVKLQFIKAQRMRRLILGISALVSVISLVILVLLIGANQLGKKHLSDLSSDITKESKQLQGEPQINNILTVQNQLESLTGLHATKPSVARLFDYLNRLTPAQVSITNYTSDFTLQTVTITGTADTLSNVNQYVDTLKFTKYSLKDDPTTLVPAFKSVVLSAFSLGTANVAKTQAATYGISFSYDPAIFDITKTVELAVPSLVTTRSTTNQPASDLFTAAPAVPNQTGAKTNTAGGAR
jgi:hypothetical protein